MIKFKGLRKRKRDDWYPFLFNVKAFSTNSYMFCTNSRLKMTKATNYVRKLFNDGGCLPFTKRFWKIGLESKWNTTFRVVPAENSREQRNIRKGSTVSLVGIFQTEIPVLFLKSHLWYQFQAFEAVIGSRKWFVNFAYHLPKPWTDRFAHVNGKQPVFPA